jgi:hypothetical protein
MRNVLWAMCVAAALGLTGTTTQAQPEPDLPLKELPPVTADPFTDPIFNPPGVPKTANSPNPSTAATLHDAATANNPFPLPATTGTQVECTCGSEFITWLTAEWVIGTTRGPSLVPIITTGPASAGLLAGAVGQPTTLPLFGGKPVLNDWRSGLRVEAGIWLDNDRSTGISARIYSLFSAKEVFAARSVGVPVVNLPQFNLVGTVPVQTPLFIGFPGIATGSVTASARTSFTGGDLNFRRLLDRGENYRVELLAGYRQLHLSDGLSTAFDTTSTVIPGFPLLAIRQFGGDNIHTANNFYGPQLGLYASTGWNRFTLEGHASSALGVTVSDLDFARSRTLTTTPLGNSLTNTATLVALGVPPATAAGILPTARGLATNQASLTRANTSNTLAYLGVVAEGGARVSYRATDHVRLTAGYSFLYWNNVRRAQEMFVSSPNLRPRAVDFTTHIVSVGLDLRY